MTSDGEGPGAPYTTNKFPLCPSSPLADFSFGRVLSSQPGRVIHLANFSRYRRGRVLSVGEFTCYPDDVEWGRDGCPLHA